MLGEYFSFSGRLSRKKFAIRIILIILFQNFWFAFAGESLAEEIRAFGFSGAAGRPSLWLVASVSVAAALLKFATINKRLHDLGKGSGWTWFWFLATSAYRPRTETQFAAWLVLELAALIALCSIRGTAGPNRYGPDPLDAKAAGAPAQAGDSRPSGMLKNILSPKGGLTRRQFAARIIPIMAFRFFLSSRQGAMLDGSSELALWTAFAAGYLTLWLKYAAMNRRFEALGKGPVWTVTLFLLTRNFLRNAAAGTPFAAVLWAAVVLELGVIVYLLLKGDAAQAGAQTAIGEEFGRSKMASEEAPGRSEAAQAGPKAAAGEEFGRSKTATGEEPGRSETAAGEEPGCSETAAGEEPGRSETAAWEEPGHGEAAQAGSRTAEKEETGRGEAAQEAGAAGGAASAAEGKTISFARSTPLREKLKREAREQTSESDIMYFAYAIGVMAFMQEPLEKIFPRLDYRDCREELESERINLYFHVYFSLALLVHAKRFAKGDRALERNIAVLLSACRARFIADYLSVYDEDEEALYVWDEAAYNEYFDRAEKDTGKDYSRFEQALRMIMVSDIVDNYLKTEDREIRTSLLAYASAFGIMRMPRVCGMMETFFLKADTIAEEIGLLREE